MRRITLLVLGLTLGGIVILSPGASRAQILRDGLLLKAEGPEIFYLEGGFKRWIENPEAFNHFEFDWQKVRQVNAEDLERFPTGLVLKKGDRYPDGALVRGRRDRGGDGTKVYLIRNGWRLWIETPQDFQNLGLSAEDVLDVSPEKFNRLWEPPDKLKQSVKAVPPSSVFTLVPPAFTEDPGVRFRFTGRTGVPERVALAFDTFLAGIDAQWVPVSGEERVIQLPPKAGRYTLYLRARTSDNRFEPVPQKTSFEYSVSPSHGEVALVGINPGPSDPQRESVTLEGRSAEPVDLSGWTIGSEKGNTRHAIPAAVEIPNHPGAVKEPIRLQQWTRLTVIPGKSPLGTGFRLNNCMGYLRFLFDPPLGEWCPRLTPEQTNGLSAYCKEKLARTPVCQAPGLDDFLLDNQCRQFINENLNYQSCVLKNRPLHTFFRDEWVVYLELAREVWAASGDAVVLRDPQGLVVARWWY